MAQTSTGGHMIRTKALHLVLSFFDTVTFEEVDHLYCELKFDATRYKWSNEAEQFMA